VLTAFHVRDLLVDPGEHPRGLAHLSAASGLAQVGPWLYVVADDEHHLGMFEASGAPEKALRLHRILAGDLPQDKGNRKKRKPDLEALAVLPATADHPQGVLLALGSGSRPNRQQAFVMALDGAGAPAGMAAMMDLAGWYEPLRSSFPDLNIEGAFAGDGRLHLLQRGNKGDARNACIEYQLADVQDWIAGRSTLPPAATCITEFALGEVDGVPLGFTDGAALPGGGWIFSAVAEDTGDSYADGACGGSAVGWVSADGQLQRIEAIAGAPKAEGIALVDAGRLLMVTDSDDPTVASQLLALDLR
jgi:hypothetical protein